MTIEELRESSAATVTVKDAAAIVGVDARTLSGELSIHGGGIPARRIGRRIVIPRDAFLAWLSGEESSAATQQDQMVSAPVVDTAGLVRLKLLELLANLEVGS